MAEEQGSLVKSADRTLEILEVFSADPRPRTFVQLLQETGIPKSSLHALLGTLVHRAWLTVRSPGAVYSLGSRTVEVGAAFLRTPGRDSYDYVVSGLCDRLGETVNVGILDGDSVLYLSTRRPPNAIYFLSSPGLRLPAHATALGKALLANLPPAEVLDHVSLPLKPLTARTVTSEVDLLSELEKARSRGYATEWEETSMGASCTAICAKGANEVIAIGVAVPTARMVPGKQEEIVAELAKAKGILRDSSQFRS